MMDSATGCDVILVSYSTQRVVATGTDHREEGGGDWEKEEASKPARKRDWKDDGSPQDMQVPSPL
jgi:hypothetical protein